MVLKMDYILIENLEVYANHGVFKEENALGQKFIVSAKLYLELEEAGKNDDLEMTVNYAKVCEFITSYLKNNTFKLIEAAADHVSKELLLKFSQVTAVDLSIKKPWAPIGLPLEYVSVNISRKWHEAYLSIGSNMGDKKQYLDNAVRSLGAGDVLVEKVSDYIETKAYGVTDQDDFLNGAVKIRTLLSPMDLLDKINIIEIENGRVRKEHWGPRTLDIDILFYDDLIVDNEKLTIPHIDMANREFVLKPMCQLNKFYIHPVYQKTVSKMYEELTERCE